MEHIKNIEEYISTEMGGKIAIKKRVSFAGIFVLVLGLALLVLYHLYYTSHAFELSDTMVMLMLTVGIVCLCVGLIFTLMSISGAFTYYVYLPTNSRMKGKKRYVTADSFSKNIEAIRNGDKQALGALKTANTSNRILRCQVSQDGAIMLVQLESNNLGHGEYETPVICLEGPDTALLKPLL